MRCDMHVAKRDASDTLQYACIHHPPCLDYTRKFMCSNILDWYITMRRCNCFQCRDLKSTYQLYVMLSVL